MSSRIHPNELSINQLLKIQKKDKTLTKLQHKALLSQINRQTKIINESEEYIVFKNN